MIKSILIGVLIGIACFANSSKAVERCGYDVYGALVCTAEINYSQFVSANIDSQYQSQWCWAAAISAVFQYHGYEVSQSRIVNDVYGSLVNLPAYGVQIAQQLNRDWVDDNGKSFRSRLTGAYDVHYGIDTLSYYEVTQELIQNRPLVIGNSQHAMVLTSVTYYKYLEHQGFISAVVFDPWPGIGFRQLSYSELFPVSYGGQMQFLASASVEDITPRDERDPIGDSDSAGTFGMVVFVLLIGLRVVRRR